MGKYDTTKEWSAAKLPLEAGHEIGAGCDRDASARRSAADCSAVIVDNRTFETPLEAAMHLLWLIQRLSYCEPHRDGMPADGPRLREAIRESRKLIDQLGYEPGKSLPNADVEARRK